MAEAYIVWNAARNEGVIFVQDPEDTDGDAWRSAHEASTGQHGMVGSLLGSAFYEAYEDDDERPLVEVDAATLLSIGEPR